MEVPVGGKGHGRLSEVGVHGSQRGTKVLLNELELIPFVSRDLNWGGLFRRGFLPVSDNRFVESKEQGNPCSLLCFVTKEPSGGRPTSESTGIVVDVTEKEGTRE